MLPEDYESIHGWCTIEKAKKLMELVLQTKPALIVELGVFGGKSLLPLALASSKYNTSARVIGIDAWSAEASLEGINDKENDNWWKDINYNDMMQYTQDLMDKHNVDKQVELWKAKSAEVVDKFIDNSIDILHQDSNHSEEISTQEVEYYFSKVKLGGYWIFDDVNWNTTQKAQKMLVEKGCIEIYVDPLNTWKIYHKLLL